jgi:hypothetical protein
MEEKSWRRWKQFLRSLAASGQIATCDTDPSRVYVRQGDGPWWKVTGGAKCPRPSKRVSFDVGQRASARPVHITTVDDVHSYPVSGRAAAMLLKRSVELIEAGRRLAREEPKKNGAPPL